VDVRDVDALAREGARMASLFTDRAIVYRAGREWTQVVRHTATERNPSARPGSNGSPAQGASASARRANER
jgi:hypothetical protein